MKWSFPLSCRIYRHSASPNWLLFVRAFVVIHVLMLLLTGSSFLFHVLVWLKSFSVLLSVPESWLLHLLFPWFVAVHQLSQLLSCHLAAVLSLPRSLCPVFFFCSFHPLCPLLSISSPFLFEKGSPSVAHAGREHGVFLQITDKCHFLYNFF